MRSLFFLYNNTFMFHKLDVRIDTTAEVIVFGYRCGGVAAGDYVCRRSLRVTPGHIHRSCSHPFRAVAVTPKPQFVDICIRSAFIIGEAGLMDGVIRVAPG